ncbi:MAG TPA: entericidin A/B family lipoprotein [Burkholderiaceae bacterium]|nr:entericidin A/B family lipoprotein [Burkholderiaceae bacterium]
MKTPIWLSIVLTMCAVVAGCNTIHGAGKDIERGGEKIQEQAR